MKRVIPLAFLLLAGCTSRNADTGLHLGLAPGEFPLSDSTQLDSDWGVVGGDAGPMEAPDGNLCEEVSAAVIVGSMAGYPVDTRGLGGSLKPSCSGRAAFGNEAIFAIDVEEGETIHVQVEPDRFLQRAAAAGGDPSLYLLGSACDARECEASSDWCDGSQGERLSFVARRAGRRYIGVDDRNSGGGLYLLNVSRPTCGADGLENGEACDDDNLDDGDGCDRSCRHEITGAVASERLPNATPAQANVLRMPAANEMIVEGAVGGSDCAPEYFAVTVPEGASLDVTVLDAEGNACGDATTARFAAALLDPALTVIGGGRDDEGCPAIHETSLAAGEYLIRLAGVRGEQDRELYGIHVAVTP